jgi:hypothetical protein
VDAVRNDGDIPLIRAPQLQSGDIP